MVKKDSEVMSEKLDSDSSCSFEDGDSVEDLLINKTNLVSKGNCLK